MPLAALRPLTVLLLLLLFAAPAAAGYEARQIGVSFPDRLGPFSFNGVHDYGNPNAGVSLRYGGQGMRLDLYIYTNGVTSIPDGTDSAAVQSHFRQTHDAVLQYARQHNRPIQLVEGPQQLQVGGLPFLAARYRLEEDGRPVESVLILTGLRGHFIKVRATYPQDSRNAAGAVQAFLEALAGLVRK